VVVGTVAIAGAGTGVLVTTGVVATGTTGGLLVFVQPLNATIRITMVKLTTKTHECFMDQKEPPGDDICLDGGSRVVLRTVFPAKMPPIPSPVFQPPQPPLSETRVYN